MGYTVTNPQPAPRAADATAISDPGLYTDEVAVTLDTGDCVAVYVERTWQENNAGLVFYASGRLINADGSTKLCPNGSEVVVEFNHLSSLAEISTNGIDALTKCHLLAVLGEPITQVTIDANGTEVTQPMIPWSDTSLANWSIRHAISSVAEVGAASNLGALLA
jgi:hypothetical protein